MDWHREYKELTERDKESFARLLSLLFEQTFLLREVWDAKEGRFTTNRDYRFAERVRPLLDAYLHVSGWALQVDGQRGVMALYNRFGRNRQPMDKLTTYFLYSIRLIYEEAMEQISGRREIIVSLRDILEKLHALGVAEKRLGVTVLQSTLQRLRKLSVLERVEGEAVHPDSRWVIYPTIRIIVSEERIQAIYDKLASGEFDKDTGDESDEEDNGMSFGDVTEEDEAFHAVDEEVDR